MRQAWREHSDVNLRGMRVRYQNVTYIVNTHIRDGRWRIVPAWGKWSPASLIVKLKKLDSGRVVVDRTD